MGLTNFTGHDDTDDPKDPFGGHTSVGQAMSSMFPPLDDESEIDDLVINYNDRFRTAPATLYRDEVISQTMAVLIGHTKPNALLVGAAGVGKTKIVEDIARRIANDDPSVPDKLKGATVYELPLSNVVSGSGIVGQLESKVKSIVEFMTDPDNNAILFIDEIHQLVGDSQIYERIAQILKPALARGDMRVIGATTLQESSNLMEDPALNRRFSRVIVDELTREQTIEILRIATRPSLMKHYGNKLLIDDDMLPVVAAIADQYSAAGNHRPDTAITLLDRACADAIMARKLKEQKAAGDPALLAVIQSAPMVPVTEKQVRKTALQLMTGHAKREHIDFDHLDQALSRIKGQDDVLKVIIGALRRDDLQIFPRTTPLTMLFAGSSGVGKTEVTKIIAQELTGCPPITLNMTEYNSPASLNRIIGAPDGYVGSDSHAELPFDQLESNPYQVILLDEFEKADKAVQRLFMSAFDEGHFKTSKGRTVDFSKSIIIATTNASHTACRRSSIGFVTSSDKAEKLQTTVNALSEWFDTELLNRFSHILTFSRLGRDVYAEIVSDIYATEVARIKSEHRNVQLDDEIDDEDLMDIVERTFVPDFGARPARKAVREYIETSLM